MGKKLYQVIPNDRAPIKISADWISERNRTICFLSKKDNGDITIVGMFSIANVIGVMEQIPVKVVGAKHDHTD